eukprot:1159990-Pelagomonas_calceolata.AAC.9
MSCAAWKEHKHEGVGGRVLHTSRFMRAPLKKHKHKDVGGRVLHTPRVMCAPWKEHKHKDVDGRVLHMSHVMCAPRSHSLWLVCALRCELGWQHGNDGATGREFRPDPGEVPKSPQGSSGPPQVCMCAKCAPKHAEAHPLTLKILARWPGNARKKTSLHCVPTLRCRAKLGTGQPLTHNELRVGQEIELYGRRFMITGCDPATRTFYEEQGQPQPPNFSAPEDQHEAAKKAAKAVDDCVLTQSLPVSLRRAAKAAGRRCSAHLVPLSLKQAVKAADELRRSKRRDPEDDLFDGDTVGPGAVFRFEEDTKKQVNEMAGTMKQVNVKEDNTKKQVNEMADMKEHMNGIQDTRKQVNKKADTEVQMNGIQDAKKQVNELEAVSSKLAS